MVVVVSVVVAASATATMTKTTSRTQPRRALTPHLGVAAKKIAPSSAVQGARKGSALDDSGRIWPMFAEKPPKRFDLAFRQHDNHPTPGSRPSLL